MNIKENHPKKVTDQVFKLHAELSDHLNDSRRGERLRDGVHVAIIGEPNVGKSSLLNTIAQRPAAIVSPTAGTTRDVIESALNIAGYPVVLSDTAGLRNTSEEIEKEGVVRALKRANSADLKVLLLDSVNNEDILLYCGNNLNQIQSYLCDLGFATKNAEENSFDVHESFSDLMVVVNKCDLIKEWQHYEHLKNSDLEMSFISCKTGDGFNEFMALFADKISHICGNPSEGAPSLTQTRHRHHLNHCLQYLVKFQNLETDIVLAAEQLRMAAWEIGQVIGVISSEDVLDVIFRDFCIGK